MARQGGLGRGLAALLPSAAEPEPHPVEHHFPPLEQPSGLLPEPMAATTVTSALGTRLANQLASSVSGLGIIYEALDGLVEDHALSDAAVVIDGIGLGRQVFRTGRRPLDDPGGEALLDAPPGLYTDPPLPPDALDTGMVTSLCTVALRMEELRYDSWHDALTGLLVRRSFDRLLKMSVARSLRYHWPFTLVVIDVDNLKEINDAEGHAAGDAALRALGERFRQIVRFGDNAARIGGDEFALILPNTDPENVPMLLERIGASQIGERDCPPFSYGVAQCPNESDDLDGLLKLADSRLYEAKEAREAASR